MRKKIIFTMVGDNSSAFGKNINKHIKINMANGVVYVPTVEIEGNNATELKQNMSNLFDTFVEALTNEKEQKKIMNEYGMMFYLPKFFGLLFLLMCL